MVAESGKPSRFADAEVTRAISTFTLAGEETKRFGGEVLPVDISEVSTGYFALTHRFPRGPVSAISPFNFPLNLIAHSRPRAGHGEHGRREAAHAGAAHEPPPGRDPRGRGVPHGAVNILHMVPEVAGGWPPTSGSRCSRSPAARRLAGC